MVVFALSSVPEAVPWRVAIASSLFQCEVLFVAHGCVPDCRIALITLMAVSLGGRQIGQAALNGTNPTIKEAQAKIEPTAQSFIVRAGNQITFRRLNWARVEHH